MLIVDHIRKCFGSLRAVDDICFEINKGDIVGFLGKNGAGKSTLMRIITSFLSATSGKIIIAGDDISKRSLTIRKNIGYLPETPPLYNNMTVIQYLKFAAKIKEVPVKKLAIQIDKVLNECNLKQVKLQTISTLSKGYKQRVGIAQAIIHEPKLLILDEPTSGLDPIQIQQVLALIKNQRDQRTVLLSAHTLTEIEKIAQHILIIKSGKLVANESLTTLLKNKNQAVNKAHDGSTSVLQNAPSTPITLEQVFFEYHQENTKIMNNS